MGLVPRNVALRAKGPKVEQYQPRALTPLAAQQLLTAAEGDRLEALYRVALSLGLREGEALGLRWKDVDHDRGALSIRVALQRVKRGRIRTVKGKQQEVADLVLTVAQDPAQPAHDPARAVPCVSAS